MKTGFGFLYPLIAALLLLMPEVTPANANYRSYATALVKAPPRGARFRPDLEAYLSARASQARRSRGLKGLKAHNMMRTAARAQALDMALGGYVGHTSRRGHGFSVRFAAFNTTRTGQRGENAAISRHRRDAVDKARAGRLFAMWLRSSGHKRNMMQPFYRYVSTGAVQLRSGLYAVQIFWDVPPKRRGGRRNYSCTTPLIC
jgi:uncharacterized protein YkwD